MHHQSFSDALDSHLATLRSKLIAEHEQLLQKNAHTASGQDFGSSIDELKTRFMNRASRRGAEAIPSEGTITSAGSVETRPGAGMMSEDPSARGMYQSSLLGGKHFQKPHRRVRDLSRKSLVSQLSMKAKSPIPTMFDPNAVVQQCLEENHRKSRVKQLCPWLSEIALSMMQTPSFTIFITTVIVANSLTIGIQAAYELKDEELPNVLDVLDDLFLAVYIVELFTRFFACGFRNSLHCRWVQFDALLVIVGVFAGWILPTIADNNSGSGQMVMLRMARLLRLAKMSQFLLKFPVLCLLIDGILASVTVVASTVFMIGFFVYVFAIMGVHLISKNSLVQTDVEFGEIVEAHFSEMGLITCTLVQFLSLDSCAAIWKTLVAKDPSLAIYFAAVMMMIPIVLMNVITASIVNTAMDHSSENKQLMHQIDKHRRLELIPNLHDMFKQLDKDGSGLLDVGEIRYGDKSVQHMLTDITNLDSLDTIFELLSAWDSNDGLISLTEFVDGVTDIALSDSPIELRRIELLGNRMEAKMDKVVTGFEGIQCALAKKGSGVEAAVSSPKGEQLNGHANLAETTRLQGPAVGQGPLTSTEVNGSIRQHITL
eukprot:gnl/TRDRNA2_/TRDRNA2_168678_c0_seq2.p1 gnl/TRDRNA2_/TRDRNA2_168678_c0~~gnl/TRDRNA2_/TRDRNA2_168678_c0_seq2.p1  ORF type:complete len:599 (-),score=87.78 gnl/TRDRNA2_/TRDRNA2_168678_c0_seq2:73-1869(-)